MEQPRIERTLQLMRLMSGNTYLTVTELAKRLDTSTRSIYRYIDTFKACGFVVEKVDDTVYRLISMPSGYRDLKQLVYFSKEEACLLTYLIDSLDEPSNLKSSLYKKLCAIFDTKSLREYSGKFSDADNIKALNNAIQGRYQVVLRDYISSLIDSSIDYVVEPFELTDNNRNVWAYDCEKKEISIFNISHISRVDTLPTQWIYEDKHSKGYIDIFNMVGEEQVHICLELNLNAKSILCREYPLAMTYITEEDGKYYFDAMVTQLDVIGRFVTGHADGVRIINSPELQSYIHNYVNEFLTVYNTDSDKNV